MNSSFRTTYFATESSYGKTFRQEGAYVFITGRRQKELDDAVKEIGTNVSGVQGDVAKLADLDRLYETVSKVKGRIDIVR
jgi:NAD(P)-dependent dehydrogenase (short-subunit alcohol dehydrogenase family)